MFIIIIIIINSLTDKKTRLAKHYKVYGPKIWRANKLGGLTTKLDGPMPSRPTNSADIGFLRNKSKLLKRFQNVFP